MENAPRPTPHAKIEGKLNKEIAKARKRFGDAFDEAEFRATNGNVKRYQGQMDEIAARLAKAMTDEDMVELKQIIEDLGIKDPDTWNAWFKPVLNFIVSHDIAYWSYINCDWDAQPKWKEENSYIENPEAQPEG